MTHAECKLCYWWRHICPPVQQSITLVKVSIILFAIINIPFQILYSAWHKEISTISVMYHFCIPVLSSRFTVRLLIYSLPSTCTEKTAWFSISQPSKFTWNFIDVCGVQLVCFQFVSLQHLYDIQYITSCWHQESLVLTGSQFNWTLRLSITAATNVVLHCGDGGSADELPPAVLSNTQTILKIIQW